MPRRKIIGKSWKIQSAAGVIERRRSYRVTYLDDSPERAEALAFFGGRLSPDINCPAFLDRMSEAEAQRYLDKNPMEEQWGMLTLEMKAPIEDDDLYRLEFIPELKKLHCHSPRITDRGVCHICGISGLKHLLIYSPLVTDVCLVDIAALRRLQTIDLQASPGISRKAFDQLVQKLPDLVDIYPPFHKAIV